MELREQGPEREGKFSEPPTHESRLNSAAAGCCQTLVDHLKECVSCRTWVEEACMSSKSLPLAITGDVTSDLGTAADAESLESIRLSTSTQNGGSVFPEIKADI